MADVASSLRDVKDVPLRQHPDLQTAAVDLQRVLDVAYKGLLSIVDSVAGEICLVFDPSVAGPLKLVLVEGSNKLREHGVVNVKELNWADLEVECDTVIYIVRPEAKMAMQIASQVSLSGRKFRYKVYFVPKRSFLCDQIFRNQGVFDILKNDIYEYQLGFVPYDTDVLSLGLDASFAQVSLDKDDSTLMFAARALVQLQSILGTIPNIQVKGDHSKKVLDMMLRMRLEAEEEKASRAKDDAGGTGGAGDDVDAESDAEFGELGRDPNDLLFEEMESLSENLNPQDVGDTLTSDMRFMLRNLSNTTAGAGQQPGQIDTLLLIDRSVDLVTPLCTALTYECVLDNLIGIRNGHATVDSDLVEPPERGAGQGQRKPKVSMSFNSADHIFKEIRDMNIDVVLSYLNAKAREIKDNWQEVKTRQQVEDLHSYVQTSLRSHVQESQLLPRHVNIVNRVRDTVYDLPFRKMWTVEREMLEGDNKVAYIEECIARQEPWTKVLRLACLQSLVLNGLPQSALDSLRRSILQTYGFELLFTLDNLEKLGLLKRKGASSTWNSLVSTFRLIPPDMNFAKPDDIAYVTSGYAPLSARLVQLAIKPGWENAKDTLKKLPGRTIYKVKTNSGPGKTAPAQGTGIGAGTGAGAGPDKPKRKVMLVYFTGGVTFAEIAALRFVSKQEDSPYEIIIASSALINGKTLLQSVAHQMETRTRLQA